MSHKGNKLIIIPEKVDVTINNNFVIVKGPLGQLQVSIPNKIINVEKKDNTIKVSRSNEEKRSAGRFGGGIVRTALNIWWRGCVGWRRDARGQLLGAYVHGKRYA